jgi:hypothetical protein
MRANKLFLLLMAAMLALTVAACESDDGGQGGSRGGDTSGGKDTQTPQADTTANGDVVDGDTTTTPDGVMTDDTGETCVPQCDGKQCGPDGCDGFCGACDDGAVCDAAGQCVPSGCDCAGMACGDDGCGGSCGDCAAGTACEANQCVPVATGTCTQTGFEKAGEQVQHDPNQSYVVYSAVNSATAPQDAILVESYQSAPYNGPTGPGTFTLTGENYADCGLCVRMSGGCTESGCTKQYLAKSGTVDITELNTDGGKFAVTLTDVQFEEVTIDPNTWVSTPVEPGGDLWCVPSFEGDAFFPGGGSGELKDECVEGGTGIMLNNNIADFEMTNCNGKKMKLHDKCGNLKVMWLIASAGWCPSCAEYLPMVADYVNQLQGQGQPIDVWVVLGEDAYGNPATQSYCTSYAQQHNLDPNKVFMDYQYAAFFENIWPYPAADGSFGVPWDALLDGDNMGFSWHSGTGGDVQQAVQGLLAN